MEHEDIHGMMEEMMSKMFSGMSVEQRVQFLFFDDAKVLEQGICRSQS